MMLYYAVFFIVSSSWQFFLCVNAWKIDNLIKSFLFYIKKSFAQSILPLLDHLQHWHWRKLSMLFKVFPFCFVISHQPEVLKWRKEKKFLSHSNIFCYSFYIFLWQIHWNEAREYRRWLEVKFSFNGLFDCQKSWFSQRYSIYIISFFHIHFSKLCRDDFLK